MSRLIMQQAFTTMQKISPDKVVTPTKDQELVTKIIDDKTVVYCTHESAPLYLSSINAVALKSSDPIALNIVVAFLTSLISNIAVEKPSLSNDMIIMARKAGLQAGIPKCSFVSIVSKNLSNQAFWQFCIDEDIDGVKSFLEEAEGHFNELFSEALAMDSTSLHLRSVFNGIFDLREALQTAQKFAASFSYNRKEAIEIFSQKTMGGLAKTLEN